MTRARASTARECVGGTQEPRSGKSGIPMETVGTSESAYLSARGGIPPGLPTQFMISGKSADREVCRHVVKSADREVCCHGQVPPLAIARVPEFAFHKNHR